MEPVEMSDLPKLVGQEVGVSDWLEITQDRVNKFADATGDHQWIHVDVEKAKQGPFGGPIAHGYLTLSLLPMMLGKTVQVSGFSMGVNYGLNKLRFPSPVPVGSKLRGRGEIVDVKEVTGGVQAITRITIEREGGDKPAAVVDAIARCLQ